VLAVLRQTRELAGRQLLACSAVLSAAERVLLDRRELARRVCHAMALCRAGLVGQRVRCRAGHPVSEMIGRIRVPARSAGRLLIARLRGLGWCLPGRGAERVR